MRTLNEIIEDAGGFYALVQETGLTVQAIRKWPENGVPDWHWSMLIERANSSAEELLAANNAVRPEAIPRKGPRRETAA